jgi:acyl-CoA thioester hydrolase
VNLLPPSGMIEGGVHRFPCRVYYEDTDAGGLVYHANYLKYAERARTEMLRLLGIEQEKYAREPGVLFAVRTCNAEFLAPARLDDSLVVESRLAELGGASLQLRQSVRREQKELVHLFLRIVCIDRAGRPVRLPPELRSLLTEFSQPSG